MSPFPTASVERAIGLAIRNVLLDYCAAARNAQLRMENLVVHTSSVMRHLAANPHLLEAPMPCGNRNPESSDHLAGRKPFYVIWCPTSPLPIVQTFSTYEDALEVQSKMAEKIPDQRFFVLQAVATAKTTRPVEVREFR